MEENIINFIQQNSPDGGFLQSESWRKFQESVGRKTCSVSASGESGDPVAWANIIEHTLPVAGKYFYVPRGPVVKIFNFQFSIFKQFLNDLIFKAQNNNIGWIRIEPNSEEELKLIQDNLPNGLKIKKSFVDMQPREILMIDISKSEDEILAGMKQKTRYNIRLAEKKKVFAACNIKHVTQENIKEFLRLVKLTSERDKITPHPESYYRQMFEVIPDEILKLYIAEYEGKIIAANLVLFFGKTATYMHGASASEHRNLMAPYLLQWRQILDAKKAGCERYDFGGVKTQPHPNPPLIKERGNPWAGITKFKTGFAPETEPVQFPGCYDIVLDPFRYNIYRILQRIRRVL